MSHNASFKYDARDPAVWLKKVKNYFIGQCPDAEDLLEWAADAQHRQITQLEVRNCGLCLDADPVQISQKIWGWLQMPLLGSGTVELDYNNGETLNGIEAWRRLVVKPRTESRSMARRFALRDKVNHPGQCKSYREMLERLVSWKVDLADYVKAGAPQPPDEDLRHALMKMLPGSMSSEMRGKAWA